MAMEKYLQLDGRKSSHYCLMITMFVFVSFCLIEVLNFKSSTLSVVQNSNFASTVTKDERKHVDAENEFRSGDNYLSDLPKDATERIVDQSSSENAKGSQLTNQQDSSESEFGDEKKKSQNEKLVKENPIKRTKSKNGQKVDDVRREGNVKAGGHEVVGSNQTKLNGTLGESETETDQMLQKNRFPSQREKDVIQIQGQ